MSHIQDISKSKNTYHIRNKPMPVGDKVLTIWGAAGYTFAFLPEPRVDKNMELVDQHTRDKSIEECGTARPSSAMFLPVLQKLKFSSMDWNDKHAVVVDDILNLL
ncbi:hypothetical protein EC957_001742 [Mortierella hygrophila]|uniref:Uncharacterized protein n=1 Tax=Mortierella hygrophila TaxID=979708 RepID=A0A9P6F611_9FUNG|nr:hypothetical protein EC957_001742 [Mortierella hygrophila]